MNTPDDDQALTREDVREILDIVDRSHLGELRLELGDLRLYVRNAGEESSVQVDETHIQRNGTRTASATSQPPPSPAPRQDSPIGQAPAGTEQAAISDTGMHVLTAPMVGILYRAPAPDQPPFVEAGDHVDPDDVVCLIEVMKLFNSITAEVTGRVADILVADGATVEYGQPIITIEPTEPQ